MKRSSPVRAFTLIEVLVVVAIIALLVAILLPSLAAARDQAMTVKCLTTQSNLPKAVSVFVIEHRGLGQAVGTSEELVVLDPSRNKYDYQPGWFGSTTPTLKPWPVAYARYLGETSLKRAEQYFEDSNAHDRDPGYFYGKFGRREIFLCPTDKSPAHNVWSPTTHVYGNISFAANEDVFGITHPAGAQGGGATGEGQCWKNGGSPNPEFYPPTSPRLEGRMEKVVRASEVVLFCDGGNEDRPDQPALLNSQKLEHGPYLENFEYHFGRLPHFRHSRKGGIASAMTDGSGKYLKPLRFVTLNLGGSTKPYVQRYGPRARVSPYNSGPIDETDQP